MNILFLSLSDYSTLQFRGLYSDLLRQFIDHGDKVYLIAPFERKKKQKERIIKEYNTSIAKIKIWNMQKTNLFEKSISMLTIESIFKRAIKKYFRSIRFGLVLYTTPPITLLKVIKYVKTRDNARTYLLLKDIFPQNALDLGLLRVNGIRGYLYKFFRRKEKKLYEISDYIGCMSVANVDYVLSHNPEISPKKVEVCPNSIEPINECLTNNEKRDARISFDIPLDKYIFVYGGNLGKPQGVPFILECIEKCKDNPEAFFLIIGEGTEYWRIEEYAKRNDVKNLKILPRLPREDYDRMIMCCDVGLIFLDHRFTIPNFPSRLLSYLQAKLPVFACTDFSSDIGKVITDGGFGWWCESNNSAAFSQIVNMITQGRELSEMGIRGYEYLLNHYSAFESFRIVMKHFE